MNKSLSVSLLILLIIGQASCGFLEDMQVCTIVSGVTTAGITLGTKAGLYAAGFSSIGPVAGSFAAASQASIGNVVAGSVFSIAQSVAMTGVVTTILAPAAVLGVGAGAYCYLIKE